MNRTVVKQKKWASCMVAAMLLAGLSACGGGDEGGGDGAGGQPWKESSLAKNLREKCGNRHKNSTEFLYCAAGTYEGKDQATGQACSTTITADGWVSFINGSERISAFKVEEDKFEFHKPRLTTHWTLLVTARSTALGTLFTGERGIELTVDTEKSNVIRIRQKFGSSLNTTCVTPF